MRLVVLLLVPACTWRVRLEAIPVPAEVTLPNGRQVVTPSEVKLRYVPFGKQTLTVTAPGYRTIETNVRIDEIRSYRYVGTTMRGSRRYGEDGSRGEIRYILVRDHGPAGTWDPEDAGK